MEPGRALILVLDSKPYESVDRPPRPVECQRNVTQEFVVVHFTVGAQGARAVMLDRDGEELSPFFAFTVREVQNLAVIGRVSHGVFRFGNCVSNDASGERQIFSRKKAAPKRDLFVGQQW
jgi:hypothetical protein